MGKSESLYYSNIFNRINVYILRIKQKETKKSFFHKKFEKKIILSYRFKPYLMILLFVFSPNFIAA